MNVRFEDTLEPVGILGGLFIIVMALLRLAETPWTVSLNNVVGTIEVAGIVLMLLVGLLLVSLSYTGDALDALSGVREETPADDYNATAGGRDESTADDHDVTTGDSEETTGDEDDTATDDSEETTGDEDDTATDDSEETTGDEGEIEFGVTLDQSDEE